MKILKYILLLIVGLFIVFILIGLLKHTVNYGHEITVNKSLEEAWAVSQDETKYGKWLEGFKSMELIEGEAGAIGSKYKVVVNPGEGQNDFKMIETVISKKELDHVEMHFDSDMMDFDQTILYSETDGKANVKTESTVKGKGIMMRSMFAIMEMIGGSFQAQEEKNLEALKTLIEENTTDYYPVPVEIENEVGMPEEGVN